MAQLLANVIFRLEKIVDGKPFYIEFQREARNGVKRLWNIYGPTGLTIAKNERENFQDEKHLEKYIENARKQYAKLGFKEPAAAKPAKTKTDEVVLE